LQWFLWQLGAQPALGLVCRKELFIKAYDTIDWNAARNQCASEDLYYPHGFFQDSLWWLLYKAENIFNGPLRFLRSKALQEVLKLVAYEDENTRFIDIGPVNKVINMMCRWFDDPEGDAFKRRALLHLHRMCQIRQC
jgi:cycloartenol synthase